MDLWISNNYYIIKHFSIQWSRGAMNWQQLTIYRMSCQMCGRIHLIPVMLTGMCSYTNSSVVVIIELAAAPAITLLHLCACICLKSIIFKVCVWRYYLSSGFTHLSNPIGCRISCIHTYLFCMLLGLFIVAFNYIFIDVFVFYFACVHLYFSIYL